MLELLHVSIKNNHMQKVMNMLPVIVVAITDILLCFAPKEYDSRLRLWLSVVNVHPLAHFNSMIACQAQVAHSYSNPDCSQNVSVNFS